MSRDYKIQADLDTKSFNYFDAFFPRWQPADLTPARARLVDRVQMVQVAGVSDRSDSMVEI